MPRPLISPLKLIKYVAWCYLALMLGWPFTKLLLGLEGGWLTLADSYYWKRLGLTVFQAGAAACVCTLLGVPTAWVLYRYRPTGLSWFLKLLLLPYLIPTIVGALAILSFAGPRGWFPVLPPEGFLPLLWGYVFYNLGITVWMTFQALERVSLSQMEAARLLGAKMPLVWRRIVWPSIANTVLTAWLLTFLFCGTSFGVALLLGGREWATLEVEVYELTAMQLDISAATVVSLMQFSLCILVVWGYAAVAPIERTDRQLQLTKRRIAVTGAWWRFTPVWLTSLFSIAPLIALVSRSFSHGLTAYIALLQDEQLMVAIYNSLRFTLMGLPCILLVGLVIASQVRRGGMFRLVVTYSPYLVSSSMLSLGLLLAYPSYIASLSLLIGGYVLLAYPLMARQVSLAWAKLPPRLIEVSRVLGNTRFQTAKQVELPLLLPAIQSGLAFAAATMLGEFAVTLFLSRPEWGTLTTLIYEKLGKPGDGSFQQALAASVLLMMLSGVVFYVLNLPLSRYRRKHG